MLIYAVTHNLSNRSADGVPRFTLTTGVNVAEKGTLGLSFQLVHASSVEETHILT